jgi:hypothetical protein
MAPSFRRLLHNGHSLSDKKPENPSLPKKGFPRIEKSLQIHPPQNILLGSPQPVTVIPAKAGIQSF